jgi:hypothetical protein
MPGELLVGTVAAQVNQHWGEIVRRLVVLLALVAVASLGPQALAVADEGALLVDVPGDGVGFTHDPEVPLLQVERLVPGGSGSSGLAVRNASSDAVRLVLTVTDVVDEEHGCLAPETRVAGEDCESDGGELSESLVAAVTIDGPNAGPSWSGPFRDLEGGVELTGEIPSGATWQLHVSLQMPLPTGNETMTDTVAFRTVLSAEGFHQYSAVAGPIGDVGVQDLAGSGPAGGAGTSPSGLPAALSAGPRVVLPMTGGTVSLAMLVLSGLAIAAGVLLLWLSRSSSRQSRPRARRTSRIASASSSPSA